jgi:hypothetical protein
MRSEICQSCFKLVGPTLHCLEACDNLRDDRIKKEQIFILETDIRTNKLKNYNLIKMMNI